MLPRNPAVPMPERTAGQINRIVVHHTAAPPTVGIDVIAKFMVNQRGYAAVSYHFFIGANGETVQTNPITAVTNQTSEAVNPGAIGIGFAGNFTDAPPTPAQIEAGARLIAWLLQQLRLPLSAVVGQKELIATQSPGIQWDAGAQWGAQLRQRIQATLAAG
ncbi:MAG: peptidoglycan recognition family protein [Anaerolineae bacterium]